MARHVFSSEKQDINIEGVHFESNTAIVGDEKAKILMNSRFGKGSTPHFRYVGTIDNGIITPPDDQPVPLAEFGDLDKENVDKPKSLCATPCKMAMPAKDGSFYCKKQKKRVMDVTECPDLKTD